MENIILTNVYGKSYRATLNSREYFVANSILLVSGVLNGSEGPLFYPIDEVVKNPDSWNGIPIVNYHPVVNGKPVSGRDPEIIDKVGLGFVYKAQAKQYRSKDGEIKAKLRAENWFDIEKTQKVDMRVWNALENNQPIELSTGLFTTNIQAPDNSSYQGVEYKKIATNYRPDHLAILPDQIGACSIAQGCGILVNSRVKKSVSVPASLESSKSKSNKSKSDKSTPSNSKSIDIKEDNMNKSQLVDWIVTNCDCWKEATDKETLNGFSESKLQKMKQSIEKSQREEEVANAARKGYKDTGSGIEVLFNEQKKEFVVNTKAVASTVPITPTTTVTPVVTPPTPQSPTANNPSMTTEDWLKNAPADIQRTFKNALASEQREKTSLIERITANMQTDVKAKMVDKLKNKDLEELQDWLLTINSVVNSQSHNNSQISTPTTPNPLYMGDPPVSTNNVSFDQNDILMVPVINWEQEAKRLD